MYKSSFMVVFKFSVADMFELFQCIKAVLWCFQVFRGWVGHGTAHLRKLGTNKLHIWVNVCPALSEVKSLCLVLIALRRSKQGQTCLGMGWYLATGKWQHHHHVSWNISSAGALCCTRALCCTTRAKEKSRLRRDIKCAEDMISLHPVNVIVIDECWILSFY